MTDATPAALASLVGSSLALTPLTDAIGLAYEVAHVMVRRNPAPAAIVGLLHALQALLRLAQTDARAWAAHVARLWPSEAETLLQNNFCAAECNGVSVIGLWVNVEGDEALEALGPFVAEHGVQHDDGLPVRVPLRLNLLFLRDMHAALAAVEDLAIAQNEDVGPPHVFSLHAIGLLTQELCDAHALCQLSDLASWSVAIREFPHLDIDVTPRAAAPLVSNLQRLLATRRRVPRPSDLFTSVVDSVKLAARNNVGDDRALAMLASATGDSASVCDVNLFLHSVTSDESAALAQAIAYALFSSESRHAIRHLRVENGVRSAVALQRVRDVVSADDPLVAMFPDCADSVQAHANTRLAASSFTLFDPALEAPAGQDAPTELTEHPHVGLRIVSRSPAWWSVMLPAWGRAWVRAADATVSQEFTEPPRHWIPTMSLWMPTTDEMAQSLAWLAFAGARVTDVALAGSERAESVTMLQWADAYSAFPNATSLQVADVEVASLTALADAVAAGHWRLKKLQLKNVSTPEGANAFFQVLEDDTHVMTQSLESLKITATLPDTPQASLLDAVLRMLRANRRLRTFELRVKYTEATNSDDVRAAFRAQHGRPRRVHVREKLALLSVASQSSTCGGLLQSLDSRILSDIFCLAGLCEYRSVRFVRERA